MRTGVAIQTSNYDWDNVQFYRLSYNIRYLSIHHVHSKAVHFVHIDVYFYKHHPNPSIFQHFTIN